MTPGQVPLKFSFVDDLLWSQLYFCAINQSTEILAFHIHHSLHLVLTHLRILDDSFGFDFLCLNKLFAQAAWKLMAEASWRSRACTDYSRFLQWNIKCSLLMQSIAQITHILVQFKVKKNNGLSKALDMVVAGLHDCLNLKDEIVKKLTSREMRI